MAFRRRTAMLLPALLLLLTGCAGAGAATTPTEIAPVPSGEPLPTSTPSADGSAAAEPDDDPYVAPPAGWTPDELTGVCKGAWQSSGEMIDWGLYAANADIVEENGAYLVSIQAEDSTDSRSCRVAGTPADPDVEVRP